MSQRRVEGSPFAVVPFERRDAEAANLAELGNRLLDVIQAGVLVERVVRQQQQTFPGRRLRGRGVAAGRDTVMGSRISLRGWPCPRKPKSSRRIASGSAEDGRTMKDAYES